MMLVELTSVPSAVLPVDALADHLRLSSGFADDGSQTARLESCLRAGLSAIEAKIGKALFQRRFMLTLLSGWHADAAHGLPIAPVTSVESVKLITRAGTETVVDAAAYVLRPDTHRPQITAAAGRLPSVSVGTSIEVEMIAGYGSDWAGVPADLQEALLSLAGDFYNREPGCATQIQGHVAQLLEPYRQLRLGGAMV